MTLPADLMLPTELERRQIFYTLKRWSSYTAWSRILGFYQAWADTIEKSLREASWKGWEGKTRLAESHYISILKGLAHCDDGVTRLRRGDKRVLRCDVNGDFAMASRGAYDHWWQAYIYIQTGDIAGENALTPYWDEFVGALVDLNDAWSECSPDIIEPDQDRSNATHTFINDHLKAQLDRMTFPVPLGKVPDPADFVLVRTGRHVPCSGIWEPVEVPAKTLISLFRTPPLAGPFPACGTMSYLHGDSDAPPMACYGKIEGKSTTWRLLWRDDRYIDGTIPEEEKSYVFLYPEAPKVARSATPDAAAITVVESGQRTSVAGRWMLQESLSVSIELSAGEFLPPHEGRTVRWVLADV